MQTSNTILLSFTGLPPPQSFSLSSVTSSPTQLSASWSEPIFINGIITGYTVYCNTYANQTYEEQVTGYNEPIIIAKVDGTTLVATLTGLSPYTQYSCYVTANTLVGEGSPSVISTSRTVDGGMLFKPRGTLLHILIRVVFVAPPPPYNLTAYNPSSTLITLNWTRPLFPNGIIMMYLILYYPAENTNEITNITTLTTSLTIRGLAFYTLYTFRVSVVTSGGTSASSDPISKLTSEGGTYYNSVCTVSFIDLHTINPT